MNMKVGLHNMKIGFENRFDVQKAKGHNGFSSVLSAVRNAHHDGKAFANLNSQFNNIRESLITLLVDADASHQFISECDDFFASSANYDTDAKRIAITGWLNDEQTNLEVLGDRVIEERLNLSRARTEFNTIDIDFSKKLQKKLTDSLMNSRNIIATQQTELINSQDKLMIDGFRLQYPNDPESVKEAFIEYKMLGN
ncbi:hypothetical protein RYZ59_19545 [Citrobacter sp. HN-141]|uniref:hypothetical protein n=1 Tax=unclassified Citrobacter TaxID=2644389 RepID=UPI0029654978|nr:MULTISPECIES: hypothetical protein [unclassified Citrobacter]MDW2645757.1 hypothetical protein [Citrobacter sp. HN-141]MDW2655307.1 hypothetical protein [Citrobacter sp. HN-120]MDW2698421.1 hypothetical protein [Citrobacter sp. HN-144]